MSDGGVAKLADAPDLGSDAERRVGSSPSTPTIMIIDDPYDTTNLPDKAKVIEWYERVLSSRSKCQGVIVGSIRIRY